MTNKRMINGSLLVLVLILIGPTGGLSLAAEPSAERITHAPGEDTQARILIEPCKTGLIEGRQYLAQTGCCDGHRGVCGCRGGRIVCCDGTVSNCACHADSEFVPPR